MPARCSRGVSKDNQDTPSTICCHHHPIKRALGWGPNSSGDLAKRLRPEPGALLILLSFFDWEMPTLTGFTAEQFKAIAEKLPCE
jgi:hypothetical protein